MLERLFSPIDPICLSLSFSHPDSSFAHRKSDDAHFLSSASSDAAKSVCASAECFPSQIFAKVGVAGEMLPFLQMYVCECVRFIRLYVRSSICWRSEAHERQTKRQTSILMWNTVDLMILSVPMYHRSAVHAVCTLRPSWKCGAISAQTHSLTRRRRHDWPTQLSMSWCVQKRSRTPNTRTQARVQAHSHTIRQEDLCIFTFSYKWLRIYRLCWRAHNNIDSGDQQQLAGSTNGKTTASTKNFLVFPSMCGVRCVGVCVCLLHGLNANETRLGIGCEVDKQCVYVGGLAWRRPLIWWYHINRYVTRTHSTARARTLTNTRTFVPSSNYNTILSIRPSCNEQYYLKV